MPRYGCIETVDDAALFVGERTLLRLRAYKSLWDSFGATVESHRGALAPHASVPVGAISK